MKKTARRKERKDSSLSQKGEKGLKDIKTRRLPCQPLGRLPTGNRKLEGVGRHGTCNASLFFISLQRHVPANILCFPYAGILCIAKCTCWHAHTSTLA
ncbi:hypothetical protein CDAR_239881 [Caerostris darwini]|uniref:Uncharacterized protein n=1 Tax=Caerostris darwini TaxID=1538125 RepID=A0AAV4QWH9_9ARAC|nr:hypothetical protein CDAR_239881 [Caerostris darwini]